MCWCIIIPILVGLISALLGYLLGRFLCKKSNPQNNELFLTEAEILFGKIIRQDDLKLVEGIGSKIEKLFHNAGIKTWKQLSETSVEKCQEILHRGGRKFHIHDPSTWPQQTKLMCEGKWQELKKWQDELDGGRE